MTARLRPAAGLVFSLIAIALYGVAVGAAAAAPTTGHKAIVVTDIARTGFLDLKTFLVVPLGDDGEIGIASQMVRVISPETLFARQPRMDLLKSFKRDGALRVFDEPGIPMPAANDDDTMSFRVNGQPFSMSLGLEDAIIKDMETNIRAYGDPGIFLGGAGFASASYLGTMTRDVMEKIERLENMAMEPPRAAPASLSGFVAGPVYVIPTPPALPVFAAGLVMIGWLRRRRGREAPRTV